MRLRLGCVCVSLLLAACAPPASDGSVAQPIVAGSADTGDSGVILWIAAVPGANTVSLCTAEVISPHVVLTAAHCVSPDAVGAGAGYTIMTLPDESNARSSDFIDIAEAHFDPAFVNDLASIESQSHDIAVGILTQPLGIAPMSYNHTPFGGSYRGKTARIVGYGVDAGSDIMAGSSAGVRRQGSAKITAVNDAGITLVGKTNDNCEGDSGGPAMVAVAGRETIAGITSYGDMSCTPSQGSVDTNVASFVGFVDQYVDAADPVSAPGALGAACAINRDCASQVCGSDGKATYCMQSCDSSMGCPMGYHCGSLDGADFCIQGPAPKGCAVAGRGTPSGSALLLVAAALALLAWRRRAA